MPNTTGGRNHKGHAVLPTPSNPKLFPLVERTKRHVVPVITPDPTPRPKNDYIGGAITSAKYEAMQNEPEKGAGGSNQENGQRMSSMMSQASILPGSIPPVVSDNQGIEPQSIRRTANTSASLKPKTTDSGKAGTSQSADDKALVKLARVDDFDHAPIDISREEGLRIPQLKSDHRKLLMSSETFMRMEIAHNTKILAKGKILTSRGTAFALVDEVPGVTGPKLRHAMYQLPDARWVGVHSEEDPEFRSTKNVTLQFRIRFDSKEDAEDAIGYLREKGIRKLPTRAYLLTN